MNAAFNQPARAYSQGTRRRRRNADGMIAITMRAHRDMERGTRPTRQRVSRPRPSPASPTTAIPPRLLNGLQIAVGLVFAVPGMVIGGLFPKQ